MATVLIGTEVAEGMGHVAPWLDFCRMAVASEHRVHFAAPDMQVLHRCISDRSNVRIWAAPRMAPAPQQAVARSWPELLVNLGYGQPDALSGAIATWASLLEAMAPDGVIADYAPALMAACHLQGVPFLEAGGGFCVPSVRADGRMPPFPGIGDTGAARAAIDAAQAVLDAALRHAARRWAGRHPGQLYWAELHRAAQRRLVLSPQPFDHYDKRSEEYAPVEHVGFLGLGGGASPTHDGLPRLIRSAREHKGARHMIGYLKRGTPRFDDLLAELQATGLPGRIHVPGLPQAKRHGTLELVDSPLDLDRELSPGVLFVTNGGLGSVGLACRSGAQLLVLPQQVEQVAMLRRLAALANGATPASQGIEAAAISAEERVLHIASQSFLLREVHR